MITEYGDPVSHAAVVPRPIESGGRTLRSGDRLVRTAGEDEGLMVLRFGPSLNLRLTDAIVCESRSGDDW